MRIVSNTGTDRVVDLIQPWLRSGHQIDLASDAFSLHAFGELAEKLSRMANARLESRITELSASARTEKQISRQVDINLELKRLRTNRDALRTSL